MRRRWQELKIEWFFSSVGTERESAERELKEALVEAWRREG